MKRIAVTETQPGMKLARTLYYDYGGVMLSAGVSLDWSIIEKLKEFGYHALYIYDEETEDIDAYEYLDEKERQKIVGNIRTLFKDIRDETERSFDRNDLYKAPTDIIKTKIEGDNFKRTLKSARLGHRFKEMVGTIVDNLLSDQQIAMCVGTLKSEGTYIYDHSIEVAIHSALLARKFGFRATEIKEIVIGALLHDIGYLFIPEDIIKKRGKPTETELRILERHTLYGYYLLKDIEDIPLLSAHLAYQHHERQDGLGFPRGLRGNNYIVSREEALKDSVGMIHRYANILSVPNCYDSLTSMLPYKKSVPPDEAVRILKENSGTMLNKEVVDKFLSYLPVYPVGTQVIVTSGKYAGYKGIVVKTSPLTLEKPTIRLVSSRSRKLKDPIHVDLAKEEIPIKTLW